MAFVRVGGVIMGEGGGSTIQEYWQGTQAEYEALSTYSESTQYVVLTDELNNIYRIYNGNTLVFPSPSVVSDYDFYIEDFYIPNVSESTSIKTTLFPNIFSTTNYSRDWQIDYNAEMPLNASELTLFGTATSIDPRMEYMGYNGYYRIYTAYPSLSGDRNIVTIANGNNKKTTIKKENNKLKFYLEDVLLKEFDYVVSSGNDNQTMRLGLYAGSGGNYYGRGIKINMFGFKWLS